MMSTSRSISGGPYPADEVNYVSAGASRVRMERWWPGDSPAAAAAAAAAVATSLGGTEEEHAAGEAALEVKAGMAVELSRTSTRDSTDVETPNRVRASVRAFAWKVIGKSRSDFGSSACSERPFGEGSWGTKVEAVVRRVLWLLDESRAGADSATKVLVFSEWEDALRVGFSV
jgi:hypothetical protein